MLDKHTQLIEASIDLFAHEGFWNTSTARIAKHAGVATGTLFNYFATKDALIDGVYQQLKQEWIDYILAGYPETNNIKACIEHVWYRFIMWGLENPIRYRLMEQLRISDLVSAETHQAQEAKLIFMHELVQAGQTKGTITQMSTDYFLKLLEASLTAALEYAMQQQLIEMRLTQHITLSFRIFWKGVTA